ncbi:MAG: nucleotide sugar dehydrogenase [Gammaproteobacteria bacterium]
MSVSRISIFGLGYVGAVSAACLARDGHTVIGVDPNKTKVDLINQGKSPIVEKDLDDLIRDGVAEGRLSAVSDAATAVANSDISFVCVGTPSAANGSLDLSYVEAVCAEIGTVLKGLKRRHTVVIRSTILPGTMEDVVLPALRKSSGGEPGKDFTVLNNPEFLREGTAVHDYFHPPKTVIGAMQPEDAQPLEAVYANLPGPKITTSLQTAELVKYVDNVWHALKVGFANEIGAICKQLHIDSHPLMDIFCQDRKLNISPTYLKPGFAFGGSCLPKDVRALGYKAQQLDLKLPIIGSILQSNELHLQRALEMVTRHGRRPLGVLGLSFKPGTDDLRESPMVELVERLLGKGYDLRIYDRNVSLASLMGANRDFIFRHIPHIAKLLVPDINDVIQHGEVLVISHNAPEFSAAISHKRPEQVVVDYARVSEGRSDATYDGIAW